MNEYLAAVTLLTALGAGVAGGVFFAFTSFVMPALSRLPPAQGISAMQAINVAAIPSAFFMTGLGAALGSSTLLAWGLIDLHEPFAPLLILGSALYLCGAIGVTLAFNLPRNDSLATVDAEALGALDPWTRYLAEWHAWNNVRSASAIAASGTLTAALLFA